MFNLHLLLAGAILLLLAAPLAAEVQLPAWNAADPIAITAQAGNQWQLGSYEVWVLRGNCVIQQGQSSARSREAVLWIDRARATDHRQHRVIAYLEGNVEVASDGRPGGSRLTDQAWLGHLYSGTGIQVRATTIAGKPDALPPIYWRGMERRGPESADSGWRTRGQTGTSEVQQTQFAAPMSPATPETVPAPAGSPMPPPATPGVLVPGSLPGPVAGGPPAIPGAVRRISVYPRSDVPMQFQGWQQGSPAGNQWVAVINSGVNVILEGVNLPRLGALGELGTVDISADRLVIWTSGLQPSDLSGSTLEDQRKPLELYMEGNVVFRQGQRTIYADRMYYDVPNQVGRILNAELKTPAPGYEGLLRLHADILQQTASNRFVGQNAFITSSLMGEPGYRIQAGDLYYEDIQMPLLDAATGQPLGDPYTHAPIIKHQMLATASNDFVFVGPVPIFYWPVLATDLNDPTYYIRRVQLRQDNIYGVQVLTHWNGYELLGVRNKPAGTDLDFSLDYLGQRGFGHGGSFTYDREGMFGIPGHVAGLADYWGIQDQGTDNLGQGRTGLQPEKSYRYRLFWQHRELLPYDFQLSGELGWISDRNFLEEYYKGEWDQLKDQTTGLELKRLSANRSLSISADYRLNDFFTQTDWLPRADHFWVGQPLFRDAFTWYEHSNIGYARFNRLQPPANPNDQPFSFLPWEASSRAGERLATRQEIDWPFQLGVVKVVPYAMGELAHWGQDINGQPLDRIWGQAGVRASMPISRVDPAFSSELLNVHGIAHKVVFDFEFSAADSNRHLTDLPLYDPLDDDSVEAFRRIFATNTFGWPSTIPPTVAVIPTRFDERFYALRTGLQSWVTSPSTEIADDLMAIRLGAHQRWQTKRGPPLNRHIIDWITLDTNVTFFPNPSRDDFGKPLGLLDYDFRWHVGDRLTLVSDAIFDFFDQGQKFISVGGFLTRPPRGSLYAGFRILQGPIDSKILSFSYAYWMSPKWLSAFGTTIDLGRQGNLGQNFSITRVGESFLISAGVNVDPTRNSVGANLAIEPRFVPKNRLGSVGGAQIPPAGAGGLE